MPLLPAEPCRYPVASPEGRAWYVCRRRARQEKSLARELPGGRVGVRNRPVAGMAGTVEVRG